MGFRKGRETVDAIYMVENAVQNVIEKEGGIVYALFGLKSGV